jgi:hypothetical protein
MGASFGPSGLPRNGFIPQRTAAAFSTKFPCYLPDISLIWAAVFPVNLVGMWRPFFHRRLVNAGSNSWVVGFFRLFGDFSLYFGRNFVETDEHNTASTTIHSPIDIAR